MPRPPVPGPQPPGYVPLHVRSWHSFLRGASSPEALAARAAALGYPALALTDYNGVYGAVRFAQACAAHGLRPLYGAEVEVVPPDAADGPEPGTVVLLAPDRAAWAALCRLLSAAHARDRRAPRASFGELEAAARAGLFCLTGGQESVLWRRLDAGDAAGAQRWVGALREAFGERLSVELAHALQPEDGRRLARLARVARYAGAPLLATGDVRHAERLDYRRLDLMACTRLGLSVFDPHPARPRNGERCLKAEAALRRLLPYPAAFARAAEVAAACGVGEGTGFDLLPGEVSPPAARLPEGVTADAHLRALCRAGLRRRYPADRYPAGPPAAAIAQARRELEVIRGHGLEEFFLVVREVVEAARVRGIRSAGRGSAANSIVAYLLGITHVDPLEHNLLFERFLHRGRRGTPDIDVDFDAERRGEVIAWMEERFGAEHTAMTATVVTYRARSAVRDAAKALGWTADEATRAAKACSPHGGVAEQAASVRSVLGAGPLVEALVEAAEGLLGAPRHLGQHAGGMVLARRPLSELAPVEPSANGVRLIPFDKDDVEALGLVKLDVLGLRVLAAVSEAEELVRRHEGVAVDLEALGLDDARTFNLIRAGRTLGCFQIESQGQLHLLGQHQPEAFGDLVTEVALFRPGPLQGRMVQPFVRRRHGREPVVFAHPALAEALADTYGVILFQEQVLEVAHRFAGLPLEEADAFRQLVSKHRDRAAMAAMRGRFVRGAVANGAAEALAEAVFEQVSMFVGYGFCRSHAAAFARTVYHSCYLKAHHPAAYLAAVMEHRPGFYPLQTLEAEARHFGVRVRPPDLARSGVRYDLEPDDPAGAGRVRWAIRKPLTAVRGVSAEAARALVWERARRPFAGLQDFYERAPLDAEAVRHLARAGALDGLLDGEGAPGGRGARDALWAVGVLERRLGPPGRRPAAGLFGRPEAVRPEDLPDLPPLSDAERLAWDVQTHDAARRHPMTLVRRRLQDLEVRPIETCYRLGRRVRLRPGGPPPVVTVAGLAILRQRPPTANGVLFVTVEDETGMVQCVVRPEVLERLDHVVRGAALVVRGELSVAGNWRGLVVTDAWPLDGVFGGYAGHPSWAGGRDTRAVAPPPPDGEGVASILSRDKVVGTDVRPAPSNTR